MARKPYAYRPETLERFARQRQQRQDAIEARRRENRELRAAGFSYGLLADTSNSRSVKPGRSVGAVGIAARLRFGQKLPGDACFSGVTSWHGSDGAP